MEHVNVDILEILNSELKNLSSNNAVASIYRVAQKLRGANEAAYTPQLVSIGPLHHGLPQLEGMKACKLRFLNSFLSRFGIDLKTLVDFSKKNESSVRAYYEGTINLSGDQLAQMILLDSVFIVELFLQNHFSKIRDSNEMVFKNNWMYKDLLHDMLLVENQLPLTILQDLSELVDISFFNEGIKLTIYDLAHKFFKDVGNTQKIPLTTRCHNASHFVEFLLILHAPLEPEGLKTLEPEGLKKKTFMEIGCMTLSATMLQQAGVKIRAGEDNDNSLFKIDFDHKTGVLTVPKLTVNHSMETFFTNLIAVEQCGYSSYSSAHFTSYVILMGSFINGPRDVDLLIKRGIIRNELGDSQVVADLFNNLYKEFGTETKIFYFDKLCQDLIVYRKDWVHDLRERISRNPRITTVVTVSGVALILTVIQTVCSMLQLDYK